MNSKDETLPAGIVEIPPYTNVESNEMHIKTYAKATADVIQALDFDVEIMLASDGCFVAYWEIVEELRNRIPQDPLSKFKFIQKFQNLKVTITAKDSDRVYASASNNESNTTYTIMPDGIGDSSRTLREHSLQILHRQYPPEQWSEFDNMNLNDLQKAAKMMFLPMSIKESTRTNIDYIGFHATTKVFPMLDITPEQKVDQWVNGWLGMDSGYFKINEKTPFEVRDRYARIQTLERLCKIPVRAEDNNMFKSMEAGRINIDEYEQFLEANCRFAEDHPLFRFLLDVSLITDINQKAAFAVEFCNDLLAI